MYCFISKFCSKRYYITLTFPGQLAYHRLQVPELLQAAQLPDTGLAQ